MDVNKERDKQMKKKNVKEIRAKTKADHLMLVKVGSDDRPAGPQDIKDIQVQLAMAVNDPNLTLVTHHAVQIETHYLNNSQDRTYTQLLVIQAPGVKESEAKKIEAEITKKLADVGSEAVVYVSNQSIACQTFQFMKK